MHERSIIEQLRPQKNQLDPDIPYHFLHEQEPGAQGEIEAINTIFLTGSECAFRCLMCDLWKNTLDNATAAGAILKQIDYALKRLPPAETVKLYNSSNFFDRKAVPSADYGPIAERLHSYSKVIVENHPNLCGKACLDFKSGLGGALEIAMGLETIHPEVLPRLNKQMTAEDFKRAASFLSEHDIDVRAFVLLNPPFITDIKENIDWSFKTVQFAFQNGASSCAIIPTRDGNGIMEALRRKGDYLPPTLGTLEYVFELCLSVNQGRVFVDTWDIGFLSHCPICFEARRRRLDEMNLLQRFQQRVSCSCCTAYEN